MPRYRYRIQGVYVLVDARYTPDEVLPAFLREVAEAGACAIQMRDKDVPWHQRWKRLEIAREVLQGYDIPLIVNDDPLLMKEIGAEGVHLGADEEEWFLPARALFPDRIIGVSCYDLEERALRYAVEGADYVAMGSVFDSRSEPHRVRVSLDTLERVCQMLTIPVVAIGGITPENVHLLRGKCDAVAVMHAVTRGRSAGKVVEELRKGLGIP